MGGKVSKTARHTVEDRFHFDVADEEVRLSCVEPGIGVEEVREDCRLAKAFGRTAHGRCLAFRTSVTLPFRLCWRLESHGMGVE